MKHKNIGQKNKQKSLISNNQTLIEKNSLSKNIIGFLIFFIIILIIIPYYLFKHDNYEFLSMYLPNVDIIATVLSFKGGFFTNHLFSELYPENAKTSFSTISIQIINYIALLGLTFLVSKHTLKTKTLYKGWSIAFIMIIVTYLLPGLFIPNIMNRVYNYIDTHIKNNKYIKHNRLSERYIKYIPSLIIGIILSIGTILSETYIIELIGDKLSDIIEKIMNIVINI